jgi:DNA-binding transcriptional LysR family regulator
MNLKALRAFCLIVTRGSLAAAAEEMHLSQPAVSHLIANLEHELKLKLFSRDKRTLVPTTEGRSFYREASRAVAGIEQLPQAAAEIGAGRQERLRVVVMARLAQSVAAPAFAEFAKVYPQIPFAIEVHRRRDIERWMANQQFDLGFEPLPVTRAGIVAELLFSSRLLVAIHASSPLARKSFLEAADLRREPLIAPPGDTLLRQQLNAVFQQARLTPNLMIEASPALACQIVAGGVGYTLCDAFLGAGTVGDGLALVPLVPTFTLDYGVIRPEGREFTLPMQALTELVRRSAEDILRRTPAASAPVRKRDSARRPTPSSPRPTPSSPLGA